MRAIRVSIVILISFILSISAIQSENNIAYFNVELVLSTSIAGKSIKSQLDKINKSNIEKFKKKEDELKSEEKSLLAKKNILSDKDFKIEVDKLKSKITEFKKSRNLVINGTNTKGINATKKILSILNPILVNYAKNNDISIILDKQKIVMGKSELDITEKILKLVNKEIKPFKIK